MNQEKPRNKILPLRTLIQWGFFLWVLFIGIRFGLFVSHFENSGAIPLVQRPAGVDGFLPIGALVSLKQWLFSGTINPVHPAALVIFVAAVLMSLVAKKSFCSWLCPIGTASEAAAKAGQRLLGRNFRVWRPLDLCLRGIKYLLLFFFVKVILIDMPLLAAEAFLGTPYWAVSDVKMLRFFTAMSGTTMAVLAVLAVLSLLYTNFWCRYLCPYGALLGLASLVSPWKIRRNVSSCTGCGKCSASCPSLLPVHEREVIRSPECSGCLNCTAACPQKDALQMTLRVPRRSLPEWAFPATVLLVFAGAIGVGMATGNWHSSLNYDDYLRLIPLVPYLDH